MAVLWRKAESKIAAISSSLQVRKLFSFHIPYTFPYKYQG